MNKQEAIKKIDRTLSLPRSIGSFPYDYEDGLRYAKHIINQIDEPEKPVIPQLVAEWIEIYKKQGKTLYTAMDAVHYSNHPCKDWFESNQETFAHAWLNGYEVEKEKRYTVKTKGNLGQYLGRYYLNNEELTPQFIRTQQNDPSYFTKAELERTGFGWVFDCEGVEVQEVE